MKRQIITGLAMSLALAASSHGGSQPTDAAQVGTNREITVRIHNYAEANLSVVLDAERVAGNILREAGVNTVWVECPVAGVVSNGPGCDKPFSSLDFVLNLLPRAMSDRFHLRGSVLGLAIEAGGKDFGFSASIFYDVVRDCVQPGQDLDQLLGAAFAHELGHLLLGTNSHSNTGLMSAFWSRKQLVVAQQRGLSLSSSETKRLHVALAARKLAALSGPLSPGLLAMTNTPTGSLAAMK